MAAAPEGWEPRLEVAERSALAAMNLKPERGALRVHLCNPADNSRIEMSLGCGETAFRLTPKDMIPRGKSDRIATWPCPALGTTCAGSP